MVNLETWFIIVNDTYPIIIVVTDNINQGVIESDYAHLKVAYPENSNFFLLKEDGLLETHSLDRFPLQIKNTKPEFNNSVYVYPNKRNPKQYLSLKSGGEIILLNPNLWIFR